MSGFLLLLEWMWSQLEQRKLLAVQWDVALRCHGSKPGLDVSGPNPVSPGPRQTDAARTLWMARKGCSLWVLSYGFAIRVRRHRISCGHGSMKAAT